MKEQGKKKISTLKGGLIFIAVLVISVVLITIMSALGIGAKPPGVKVEISAPTGFFVYTMTQYPEGEFAVPASKPAGGLLVPNNSFTIYFSGLIAGRDQLFAGVCLEKTVATCPSPAKYVVPFVLVRFVDQKDLGALGALPKTLDEIRREQNSMWKFPSGLKVDALIYHVYAVGGAYGRADKGSVFKAGTSIFLVAPLKSRELDRLVQICVADDCYTDEITAVSASAIAQMPEGVVVPTTTIEDETAQEQLLNELRFWGLIGALGLIVIVIVVGLVWANRRRQAEEFADDLATDRWMKGLVHQVRRQKAQEYGGQGDLIREMEYNDAVARGGEKTAHIKNPPKSKSARGKPL